MGVYERGAFAAAWARFILLVLLCAGPSFFGLAVAQDADCAEVKIVIEQKLSLERQAFDAHMVITNGLDGSALQNVGVELYFLDQAEQAVVATTDPNATGASFFFRTDSLSGIDSIDGRSTIASKTAADIHWLIIPAAGTGGTDSKGKLYYVGARVTYTLNGLTSTVDVTPDYIVVRPQPLLKLDYFLPAEVYADDPFTSAVEPPVPFTLGVRIKNIGGGTSYKTSIESAQPKIVENKQGLLIGFQILGGYVADKPVGKSLLLDFGDIAPATSQMGRWSMVTTLSGRFVAFDANYSHADSLGGAVTSLIQEVVTHTLVHDVKVDLPGRDNVRDFLAKDADVLRVYESDGPDTTVSDQSATARLQTSGSTSSLSFNAAPGFVYVRVPDPSSGSREPTRVLRSDGKLMAPENVWLSKTQNQDLSWSYFLNLFDANSTGSYSFAFGEGSTGSIAGAVYNDLNANGLRDAGEPGIGLVGIALKGEDQSGVSVSVTAFTDAQGGFSFAGLSRGRYSLQAAPQSGLVDGVALAGSSGGTSSPGQIADVAVTAGTVASGILFAKRASTTTTTEKADLSIRLEANPTKLRKGGSVALTLTAANLGPDAAADVSVTAALPAGLMLQASQTGVGTYDAGTWRIGTLATGQTATLSLTTTASELAQAVTLTAAIGSRTADLVPQNNTASIVLEPDADTKLRVEQTLPKDLRLLLLASCPDATQPDGEDVACVTAKADFAKAYLESEGYSTQIVTGGTDFRAALRSGFHNGIWISAGARKLTPQLLEEVRAALRHGTVLLLDGAPDPSLADLADAWGGSFAAAAAASASGTSVTLDGTGTPIAVAGEAWPLQLAGAQALAHFATGESAIAAGTYGEGRALVFGFDLLANLHTTTADPTLAAFLRLHLEQATPAVANPALAGSRARIRTVIENGDTAPVQAKLVSMLPTGMSWSAATPIPSMASVQQLSWDLSLPAGEEKAVHWLAELPKVSGTATIQTETLNASDGSVVSSLAQGFSLLGADVLVPRVATNLAVLPAADAAQAELLAQARTAAAMAQSAHGTSQYETVIQQLIAVDKALRQLPAELVDASRLDVARWIALAAMQWQQPPTDGVPASLIAVGGTPQTVQVGQAFAQALQAKVMDAAGRPLAGINVNLSMPASGASAVFANQTHAATALTAADGVATFPALAANNVAGSYQGLATVAGIASPAAFSLTNATAQATVRVLTAVGGGGQSTVVTTAFAQALQVRVTDAGGLPLTGISVRFTAPSAGASANFSGGSNSAQVLSGLDGVATSPVPMANSLVGTFVVTASVENAATPASFALGNVAAGAGSSNFAGVSATGTGVVSATTSGGGPTCAFNPAGTRLAPADGVLPILQNVLLPHGVFEFELNGCIPGSVVTVSTTWPNLRGITGYLKYGPTPETGLSRKVWYVPNNLRIQGNTVTYTVQDGGLGDDDLVADGTIHDPGGPVVQAAVAGAITPVPGLRPAFLAVLSLLLLGLGAAYLRRTRCVAHGA
ncbi:choice-of-anchor U domain-containing protein [Xylophilus sp. GW821-FHT01B05]